MSPASYQTAPPRVACNRWNVGQSECEKVVPSNFPTSTFQPSRAGNGTRTRDPNLGKVVLYQLSYSRAPPNLTSSLSPVYRCASVSEPRGPLPTLAMEAKGLEPPTSSMPFPRPPPLPTP